MRTRAVLVQGMQFGSEGKGQIAGLIAHKWRPVAAVCANHPNAGHTFYDDLNNKFVHRILPIGAAAPSVEYVCIGPGAVIDMDALEAELKHLIALKRWGNKELIIHPNAAILLPQHAEAEKRLVGIGSTMKGSMEAVYHKMRREKTAANTVGACWFAVGGRIEELVSVSISAADYDAAVDSRKVLIEGAQGFSLGIHERFYPYCTSRDVSTAQVLADCRIPVRREALHVVGVVRSFPIRVANRFDSQGNMIGTSGGCYDDQHEIEWNTIGRQPELTTVTRLPRRLFSFSYDQLRAADRVIQPDTIALTFCDYLIHDDGSEGNGPRKVIPDVVRNWAYKVQSVSASGGWVRLYSFGPRYDDTYERSGINALPPSMEYIR